MKYHPVYAQDFKIHVSETACSEQGGAAALESPELKEQLAAMGRRMAAQDYGVDCPAAEQAENAVSVAADFRHVAGFYRCAAAPPSYGPEPPAAQPGPHLDHRRRVCRNQETTWLKPTPSPSARI